MNITMKQLKFLTMALAMVLGLTMTSCLDTDTDPTQTAYTIAKVQDSGLYGTTFVTPGGQRITPTTESVLNYTANTQVSMSSINGQIVQVLFSWNSDVLNPDFNAQNITGVDLGNVQSLENPSAVRKRS